MITQKTIPPRAWIEMGFLALLWGASFVAVRVALDEIGPLTSVAHRVFWAMLVLWGAVAVMRLPPPRDPRGKSLARRS